MENNDNLIKIAVVDDHGLFRKGLINLIESLDERYVICLEASNGKELFKDLRKRDAPKIAIVDIDMPVMNGFETALKLQRKFPKIHVLIITMSDSEQSLIRMLRLGAKGFLSKDVEAEELQLAIETVAEGEYHYNKALTGKLMDSLPEEIKLDEIDLNENIKEFLKLCCTEMTYKEIAKAMNRSEHTIEGYRAFLFDRLKIKSRVGLAVYAINKRIEII